MLPWLIEACGMPSIYGLYIQPFDGSVHVVYIGCTGTLKFEGIVSERSYDANGYTPPYSTLPIESEYFRVIPAPSAVADLAPKQRDVKRVCCLLPSRCSNEKNTRGGRTSR